MTDALISTRLSSMTTAEALDAAFAGQSCELVRADGTSRRLPTDRWTGPASAIDVALFVSRCTGPTLDVGCGPGRLSGALWDREVNVLGLDISLEAVRQTRKRGAPALCLDIFDALPGAGLWEHVLLADGNIGLGGRPKVLLELVATLLSLHGTVLVELAGTGAMSIHEGVHLRVGERDSGSFDWATVGVDAIEEVAAAADLVVVDVVSVADRYVATLQHHRVAARPRTTGRDRR